jgi:hypothetical protein
VRRPNRIYSVLIIRSFSQSSLVKSVFESQIVTNFSTTIDIIEKERRGVLKEEYGTVKWVSLVSISPIGFYKGSTIPYSNFGALTYLGRLPHQVLFGV